VKSLHIFITVGNHSPTYWHSRTCQRKRIINYLLNCIPSHSVSYVA
jgi:hypothetical protein